MPIIDDFLFEDDYTSDDWHESILDPRAITISRGRSLCTTKIVVDFAKWKAATRFILGYSYVDENKKLRRLLPIYHPEMTWLYASKISEIRFGGPTGKTDGPFPDSQYIGVYTQAFFTIEFTETAYLVLGDDQVTTEDLRYSETKNDPYAEYVNVDPGSLKYCSTLTPPDQEKLHVPIIRTVLNKNKFKLTIREVPLDFIEDPATGDQPKLRAIQKKVNSVTFRGRKPGTLLCDSVVTTDPLPMPIAQEDFQDLMLYVDVTFNFLEWDPTPGSPDKAGTNRYGWNLQPAYVTGAAGSTVLRFIYATEDGSAAGKPQYESIDFYTALTAWNA